jgi:hypothetical protein
VAWLVTKERMGAMESMPGMGLGALGFFVTVWVVMMVAMMFPAVAPTVLTYDRLREGHRARGEGAVAEATPLFVAGYLAVWAMAGLAAYALYELVRAIDPAFLAWDEAGRYVAGGVIVAAAVYSAHATNWPNTCPPAQPSSPTPTGTSPQGAPQGKAAAQAATPALRDRRASQTTFAHARLGKSRSASWSRT